MIPVPNGYEATQEGPKSILLKFFANGDESDVDFWVIFLDDTDSYLDAKAVAVLNKNVALDGAYSILVRYPYLASHTYYLRAVGFSKSDVGADGDRAAITTSVAAVHGPLVEPAMDAIYDMVVAASELDEDRVVWLRDNGEKPTKSFIGLALKGPRFLGNDDHFDGEGLRGQREFTLEVWTYSNELGEADQILGDLQTALGDPNFTQPLYESGVAISVIGDAQNLDSELETKWEYRRMAEITLFAAANRIVELDAIETVAVDGNVEVP